MEILVPGGNQAGFGSYGAQDGEASISSAEQIQYTAERICEVETGSAENTVEPVNR